MDMAHAATHGTAVFIYERPPAGGGKPTFADIAAHLEARFDAVPQLRRRLQRVPLDLDNPYWVDDERFDITYHVRSVTLPAPGTWEQFCSLATAIHARPVDLGRPPWEMYVVDGLDGVAWLPAGSFALVAKIHHCAVDGTSLRGLTWALHDLLPEGTAGDGPARPAPEPAEAPGVVCLVSRAVTHNVLSPLRLARPLLKVVPALAPAAARFYARALIDAQAAPVTRFNAVVSADRVF